MIAGPASEEITRFLNSGLSDPLATAWSGEGVLERCQRADRELRAALVAEVRRRAEARLQPTLPEGFGPAKHCRAVLAPMVQGFFPNADRAVVLDVLVQATVFVTKDNVEEILLTESSGHTAWMVANLYLLSLGLELLSPDAPRIVGLSADRKCYVALDYFRQDGTGFEDFVIHEAAHVFHNCKWHYLGRPERKRQPWLLPVRFHDQENFAYSCEAYGRILQRARGRPERIRLAAEFAAGFHSDPEHVSAGKVGAIVQEAVRARNGWKAILHHCGGA